MGRSLGRETMDQVQTLYRAEQDLLALTWRASAVDVEYGPDPRHKLDIYSPQDGSGIAPIMLWVHGGGHVRGDKSSPDNPYEANVGRFAAKSGYLGVCMNYRLAPEFRWPAGGEDVGRAIGWLRQNAARYGGDPDRILLMGTSAGAMNCATYLQLNPDTTDVLGLVLLSGNYGYVPFTDRTRSLLYFSEDPVEQAAQVPRATMEQTNVPLFVTCAQYDPERFQQEFAELLRHRLAQHGIFPHAYVLPGHNHYSQPFHIGCSDTRLTDEILAFAREAEARHPARVAAATNQPA